MALLSFLVVSTLVVVGCRAPATPTPGAPTEAPPAEKVLVVVVPSLPTGVDPCPVWGAATTDVNMTLYWPGWTAYHLVTGPEGYPMDDTGGGEAAMLSGVFKSWDVSEDGKVWTMRLREDVIDSFGNPLKAEDAKWWFERTMASPACGWAAANVSLTSPDQVKVVDDFTLEFTLPAPNPIVLRALHNVNIMPVGVGTVRQHATDDDPWAEEWLKTNAPALGPYMIEEWEPGEQMVFVRNPHWWGEPPPIDKVIYRVVPEAASRVALVAAGEVHIATDLDQDQLDTVDETEGADAVCVAGNLFVYMGLNTLEGPTANRTVRQALAYAVPYEDILDSVFRGRARAWWSFLTDGTPNVVPQDANPYRYDLEKAKELLAEAGYQDGFDLKILVDADIPEHERMAVLIKDSFAQIGVEVYIDKKPGGPFYDIAYARDIEAIIHMDCSIVLDATYIANLWLDPGPAPNVNFTGYTEAEFNRLQDETLAIPDGPERAAKHVRMQEIMIEDSPWLFLVNVPTCMGMRENVSGWVWTSTCGYLGYFGNLDIAE